jgi:hypothetical protein
MQRIREYWNAFKNIAIILSFIANFVLIVVLLVVMQNLFIIKNDVAEPLVDGLHENFVGLNEAEIVADVTVDDEIPISFTLPVEDTIPVQFTLPVQQDRTEVVLVEDVAIGNMPAQFTTGPGSTLVGSVSITLPAGTRLPVALDMLVEVDHQLPVALKVDVEQKVPVQLNVPVNIQLRDTQLTEPFSNLRLLFEPFVQALDNLPGRWADVPSFTVKSINGEVDVFEPTEGSENPWAGFSAETYDDGEPNPEPDPSADLLIETTLDENAPPAGVPDDEGGPPPADGNPPPGDSDNPPPSSDTP